MRLTEALGKGTGLLHVGGITGSSGRDSRALLAAAVGVPADRLVLEAHRDITDAEYARYQDLLTRRLDYEPVSRILGQRVFWGHTFKITPDVLDPRPETETLIVEALAGPAPGNLLDLGTGSGILAVSLLAEWPEARGVATDISPAALAVAAENATALGVLERLTLAEADWCAGLSGAFELIISNPPYIAAQEMPGLVREVRDYDPEMALTPGGDGLDAYRAIAEGAPGLLTQGGRVLVEIGPTQATAVSALFSAAGLSDITVLADMDGRDRVVLGTRD